MEVILAKSAGFCPGVKRAVDMVYEEIEESGVRNEPESGRRNEAESGGRNEAESGRRNEAESGGKTETEKPAIKDGKQEASRRIYTYGPIIHNAEVVGDLKAKGVEVVEDLDIFADVEDSWQECLKTAPTESGFRQECLKTAPTESGFRQECLKTAPIESGFRQSGKLSGRNSVIVIRSHGVAKSVYDQAAAKNLEIVDATCPFVKKIHNIAREKSHTHQMVIIGNKNHPEVQGIMGWCETPPIVIEDDSEIEALFPSGESQRSGNLVNDGDCHAGGESQRSGNLVNDGDCHASGENLCEIGEKSRITVKTSCARFEKPLCIVSQTTFNAEKFKHLVEKIREKGYDTDVINTICSATDMRQKEAAEISAHVDVMLVIGDSKSSNTAKLVDICRSHCKDTYHIQTVRDLQGTDLQSGQCVGITAGASTPHYLIQEVLTYVRSKF